MEFEAALKGAEQALGLGSDWRWKEKQLECLRIVFAGNNLAAVLPTGYGKSIVFQTVPFLLAKKHGLTNPLILVITPLNSIMMDQCRKLNNKGIRACYLDYDCSRATADPGSDSDEDEDEDKGNVEQIESDVSLDDIRKGMYNIVYAHPESVLCPVGRTLMRNIRRFVCAVAVDESHIVLEWGDDFRQDFTRIGRDLLPLFSNARVLLLTATASKEDLVDLIKRMDLPSQPHIVACNPDRPNITFVKTMRPPSIQTYKHLDELLSRMCRDLEKQEDFPLTLMYTDTDIIAYSFWFLQRHLPISVQYGGNAEEPENRIFAQYHKGYTKKMKKHIVRDLCSEQPKILVCFSTVALGMGLDAPSIRHIIHYKAPTTLQKYFQECGRAGRSGQQSTATLYYNNTDIRSNRNGLKKSMVKYCREEDTCLRESMLKFFGYGADANRDLDKCCSVCNDALLSTVVTYEKEVEVEKTTFTLSELCV